MSSESTEIEQMLFQISRLAKGKYSVSTELGSLGMLDIQTLLFLKERGGANMSDIAGFLNIELPSSTSLINKLVKNNLVQRLSDENDRRVVIINLTETGNRLLTHAVEVKNNQTRQLLSYLSVIKRKNYSQYSKQLKNI